MLRNVGGLQSGKAGASSSCTDWDVVRKLAVQQWKNMSFEAKAAFKATWEKAHPCEPLQDTRPQKRQANHFMSIRQQLLESCMYLPGIM